MVVQLEYYWSARNHDHSPKTRAPIISVVPISIGECIDRDEITASVDVTELPRSIQAAQYLNCCAPMLQFKGL